MTERPIVHAFDYGDLGMGKSTFAATWPKPLIVWCFDYEGKDMPYRKGCLSDTGVLAYPITDRLSVPYRDVMHKDGVVRIEYYRDEDPEAPTAYSMFLARMGMFHREYEQWVTGVLDSVTFMELAARCWAELLNPIEPFTKGSDTRQHFAASTTMLERMLVQRFGNLPMNVLTLAHVSTDKNEVSGEILRGPSAPGRLSAKNELAGAYQELYHACKVKGQDGVETWQLQTRSGGGFIATSQIDAPNPCWPSYESLWSNWRG